MYIETFEDMSEGHAQKLISIYEEMLAGLAGHVIAVKCSGLKVGAKDLRRSRSSFYMRWANLEEWFEKENDNFVSYMCSLNEVEKTEVLPFIADWILDANTKMGQAMRFAEQANLGTYMAGLRFGTSFGGLSDLLRDMHGAMGYVVQRKSSEVKWMVRTKDGKSKNAVKYLYPYLRLHAHRVAKSIRLFKAFKNGKSVDLIASDGSVIFTADPKALLDDVDMANRYFGFDTSVMIREVGHAVHA